MPPETGFAIAYVRLRLVRYVWTPSMMHIQCIALALGGRFGHSAICFADGGFPSSLVLARFLFCKLSGVR